MAMESVAGDGNFRREKAEINLVLEVFGNNIIFREIAGQLPIRDVLHLSLAGSMFLKAVRTDLNFLSRLCLLLSPEKGFEELERTSIGWTKCIVDIDGWSGKNEDRFTAASHLLRYVSDLELFLRVHEDLSSFSGYTMTRVVYAASVKRLGFDVKLLIRNLRHFCRPKMKEYFRKRLTELNLTSGNDSHGSSIDLGTAVENFHENMTFLKDIYTFVRLRSFKLHEIWMNRKQREAFVSLLKSQEHSVEELVLDAELWNTGDLPSFVFPKLKRLVACGSISQRSRIAHFVKSQLQLESLVFSDSRREPERTVGNPAAWTGGGIAVLDATKLVIRRLRKLHLYLQEEKFMPLAQQGGLEIDWSFLEEAAVLEDIRVQFLTRENLITPKIPDWIVRSRLSAILSHIPAHVKHITICGIDVPANLALEKTRINDSINHFRNLRSLNLLICRNALDDEILSKISLEMPHLRLLAFSHCEAVTQSSVMQKPGIRNLDRLEELRIFECRAIPTSSFAKLFILPSLRKLEFWNADYGNGISMADLYTLIQNHPSLEFLNLRWEGVVWSRIQNAISQLPARECGSKLVFGLNETKAIDEIIGEEKPSLLKWAESRHFNSVFPILD